MYICPPNSHTLSAEAAKAFGSLFEGGDSIIVGDLNARFTMWGSPETNAIGKVIRTII
jgi:hypothetical protein